jgi:hypothetical protein
MDQTGRTLYLTGGSGPRDTVAPSSQAVKLQFSMDPLSRELKCASQQLPPLRSKRFHHSSMVVRNNLFVFFGSTHRKGHGSVPCMKFEYLPLNGNQYEFKEIDCEGIIDSKYFKMPMIFPQTQI